MTDAVELTLKQILDSPWMRRLSRLAMTAGVTIITMICSGIGWLVWQNNEVSTAAQKAAAQAVEKVEDVAETQKARAELTDLARDADEKWRQKFDASLVRVNQRISTEVGPINAKLGELQGEIGEIKGLILREKSAAMPWAPLPPPAEYLAAASDPLQE